MMTAVLGAKAEADSDRVLENIVYLELLRRENIVRVGRTGEREIGFVATDKKGQTTYYQVVRSAGDDKLLHNELAALRKLDSNKCLLSLDPEVQNLDGIQQINIINWLLGQQPAVRSPQPIAKKPATRSRRNSSVRVRSSRWA